MRHTATALSSLITVAPMKCQPTYSLNLWIVSSLTSLLTLLVSLELEGACCIFYFQVRYDHLFTYHMLSPTYLAYKAFHIGPTFVTSRSVSSALFHSIYVTTRGYLSAQLPFTTLSVRFFNSLRHTVRLSRMNSSRDEYSAHRLFPIWS